MVLIRTKVGRATVQGATNESVVRYNARKKMLKITVALGNSDSVSVASHSCDQINNYRI